MLQEAGIVASEDTRHTRTLFQALGIEARLLSYHDHNEESRARQLLDALADGVDVALVSDAGMPLVNDPGYRLVAAAIEAGIAVRPLPGASATLTALVGSGLPVHRFEYVGFLPRRGPARRTALERLKPADATLILFEAPHRLLEALQDMRDVLGGGRRAALARNLTKDDEEFLRGTLAELAARLEAEEQVRGQYTIVVEGAGEAGDDARAVADKLADSLARHGVGSRVAREVIQEVTGLPRKWVYERVLEGERE